MNMRSQSKLLPFSLKALNVAVLSALLCTGAHAAGLGKLTVLSSLGQPLRAEIELTSVSKDEAGSIIAKLASPDAFRQANIELNPVLFSLRFNVENRGGKQFIRVSSTQPINEPIVDVLLELGGSGNRLVREYTMLLDPADLKTSQSAQISPLPITKPSTSASSSASQSPQTAPVPQPSVSEKQADTTKPARTRTEKAVKSAPASQPAGEMANAENYKVKQGDTLAKIAGQVKPEGVSLDQMLVALYRANKNAFIGNNMNRLRAGQILSVPDAASAQSTSEREARGVVVAQAADFNNYRNKLAGQVAASEAQKAPETKQGVSGKITAKVEEKPTAATESKDKLKVSKAGTAAPADKATGAAGAEDRIAKDKALADANARVKELERNLGDLQNILAVKNKALEEQQKQAELAKKAAAAKPAASAPMPAAPASTAAAPAASVPAPAAKPAAAMPATPAPATTPAAASAPAASTPAPAVATPAASVSPPAASAAVASVPAASAPVAASTPAAASAAASVKPVENKDASAAAAASDAASAAAPVAKPAVTAKPMAKPVVAPAPEPSFMESLMDNPAVLFGGGGLLAALAGLAFFKSRRAKQPKKFDESVLGDDSSLTANSLFGSTGGQSVDTSNSVFNSSFTPSASQLDTNEVDPVAEADVYIAYGRDAQAEEILKEALRTQPERNAVRLKLLEIYANRKDARSFEAQATELYSMTKGEGEDWAQAAELGIGLDPNNPLYGGGKTAASQAVPAVAPTAAALSAPTQPLEDAGLDALLNTVPQPEAAQAGLDTLGSNAAYFDNTLNEGVAIPALPVEPAPAKASANTLDFDLAGLDMKAPEVQAPAIPTAPPIPQPVAKEEPADLDIGMLDFTLGQKITADSQMQVDSDPATAMSVEVGKDDLAFMPKLDLPALDTVGKMPVQEDIQAAEKAPEAMSFDLSSINLDLSPQHATAPAAVAAEVSDFIAPVQEPGFDLAMDAPAGGDSEMATKLDLAIAYQEIGDKDGARELLDEVIKGGTTEQSAKAKSLLLGLAA